MVFTSAYQNFAVNNEDLIFWDLIYLFDRCRRSVLFDRCRRSVLFGVSGPWPPQNFQPS